MKAALLEEQRRFTIVDVPVPEVGPDEVLIEVKAVAICGSEVHAFFGKHPFRKAPVITGHEFSGIVAQVGQNVTGLRKGMRVTNEPQISCGKCQYCLSSKYNICPDRISLGTRKWQGPFGNYISSPAGLVIPIPDEMSFEVAALIEPIAVGVHAVRISRAQLGDKVVIVGAGMIGIACLIAARFMGLTGITVIDICDARLELARRFGAEVVLNPSAQNAGRLVLGELNSKADVVFVATGSPEAYAQSPLLASRDGYIIGVGLSDVPCIQPNHIGGVGFERSFIGSNAYVRKDFSIALDILKTVDITDLITEIRPIDNIQQTFLEVAEHTDRFLRVVLEF